MLKPESGSETGTLYHLANKLQNSNLKLNPLDDYQRVKQAFFSFLKGYVTGATMTHLGATSVDDFNLDVPEDILKGDNRVQGEWLIHLVKPMVVKYCNIGAAAIHDKMHAIITEDRPIHHCRGCQKTFIYKKCKDTHEKKVHGLETEENVVEKDQGQAEDGDGVFNYGSTVLMLGMMLLNCDDAIREGDGQRITDMYKWWLPIWKNQESTKYSLAGLLLQVQIWSTLSEQEAHRLVWNRTVNRQGGKGRRVSLDFHMENLVKAMKQALKHLGVNLSEKTAQVEAKALQGIVNVVDSHNMDLDLRMPRTRHRDVFSQKDVDTITSILLDKEMFKFSHGRSYKSFAKMTKPILSDMDINSLKTWMNKHFKTWDYQSGKRENAFN